MYFYPNPDGFSCVKMFIGLLRSQGRLIIRREVYEIKIE